MQITSQNAAKASCLVDWIYFFHWFCLPPPQVMGRVETTFIEHFANGKNHWEWPHIVGFRPKFSPPSLMGSIPEVRYLSHEDNLWYVKGYMVWKILAAATSGVATIIGAYWDLVVNWGVLQPNLKNPWLRDKLVLSNKMVYFGAMVRGFVFLFQNITYSTCLPSK